MLLVKMVRTVTSAFRKTGIFCLIASIIWIANSGYLRAELRLESWKNYAYLAEQGAICASFSSLMEAQSVLNPDIGKLWKERRKYAGAVIRKAAEFELQRTPDSDEINNLVSKYSDWVIESLMSKDAPDFTGVDNESQQGLIGQQKMQKLIDSYCRTMFAQGDKQILASNPDLGYLLGIKTQAPAATAANTASANKRPENTASQQITLNIGQGASFALSLPSSTKPTPANTAIAPAPKTPEDSASPAKQVTTSLPDTPKPRPAIPAVKVKSIEKTDSQILATKTAKLAPVEPKKPQEIPVIAAPQTGELVIQLGSFSQKDNAETIRQKLRAAYPDMLQHIELNINEHRLTTGSLFYRIETQMLDEYTAQIICDFLWAERLPCLLKSV
ncbi:MAG: SPOR domain-containing protein [Candidatus Puniceispirillaceae bacterium]